MMSAGTRSITCEVWASMMSVSCLRGSAASWSIRAKPRQPLIRIGSGQPDVDLLGELAGGLHRVVEGRARGAQEAENVVAIRRAPDHVTRFRRDLEEEHPVRLGHGRRDADVLDPAGPADQAGPRGVDPGGPVVVDLGTHAAGDIDHDAERRIARADPGEEE